MVDTNTSTSPRIQNYEAHLTKMLLARLVQHWRRTTDLKILLQATVNEIRTFLKIDCTQICQFQADGKTQVLVESSQEQLVRAQLKIPQCGAEVPSPVLDLLSPTPMTLTVDVAARRVWQTFGWSKHLEEPQHDPMRLCRLESALAEAWAAMNVRAMLVVPIFHQQDLWGVLINYHAAPRPFSTVEIEPVWQAVEQLSAIIAQHQGRFCASPKTTDSTEPAITRITRVLHLEPTLEPQFALETTVRAFAGSGGRLYLFSKTPSPGSSETDDANASTAAQIYTYGTQPASSTFAKYNAIEQYHVWHNRFQVQDEPIWAIDDLYQEPVLQNLQPLFQPTSIRRLLMVPLWYGQHCLGYLSVFRDGDGVETSSAKPTQGWTADEIELGKTVGMHFAAALQRFQSQVEMQSLTHHLEKQVQQQTATLTHGTEHQRLLLRVITKIRQSLDIDTIFRTTTREVSQVLQAERVAVYRFNENWGGEFVNDFEFATGQWEGFSRLGVNPIWDDTHLQETQGGRYRHKETFAVADIYEAGHSPCHIELLKQYQVRAYAIVPIFAGRQLWGLLAMYQHSGPRKWEPTEVQFLNQVAEEMGVALHQAELVEQTRMRSDDLKFLQGFESTHAQQELVEVDTGSKG